MKDIMFKTSLPYHLLQGASDARDALALKPPYGLNELRVHIVRKLALLSHFEGKAGDHAEEHLNALKMLMIRYVLHF